ncbi:MAG: uroporphyrinogen decarboxylase [Acidobacteria bacterium]|nr:MAG: uroporphyrinogen decarboxylase [Acidobacteriota bacterium]
MTSAERFRAACAGQPVDRPPVWLMRQAGRYMPEYRAVRARYSLLEICRTPALAAEVTLTAARKLGVDAAIIFADLLLPAAPLGLELEFVAGEGPRLAPPVRTAADVARLPEDWHGALGFVSETIRLCVADAGPDLPVLGFAGAPFTLASYLIEGGPSTQFLHTRQLMREAPAAWDELLRKLTSGLAGFLAEQAAAGAAAVQLFDSWVGTLPPEDYRRWVLPHNQRLVQALRPAGIPVIYFSTGTSGYLELLAETGADVLSLDWRVELREAWRRLEPLPGRVPALQGNLDPTLLLAPLPVLRAAVEDLLRQARGHKGFIFNLGHGILPATPVAAVQALVQWVRAAAC